MNSISPPNLRQPIPRVVAIIHTMAGFAEAERLEGSHESLLELRVDLLQEQLPNLTTRFNRLPRPTIFTVRAVEEGGNGPKSHSERADMYLEMLKYAHIVDIELFTAPQMQVIIAQAAEKSIPVILSFHDFKKTPSIDFLREKIDDAARCGAALCKIATTTHSTRDLSALLELLAYDDLPIPLALMGMGKYGKISRPLLAQAGSRLNYGYLDRPIVSGQWAADQLQAIIDQLEP